MVLYPSFRTVKYSLTVDHYKAKANYPFLCISFYNMFPSCKDCNQLKGDREFSDDFVLYCEKGEEQDPYKFKLEDGLLNYVRTTPKIMRILLLILAPRMVIPWNNLAMKMDI